MQYLILSDMHGNAEALQAVLRRVRRKRFDAVLVLGDLVGYGAGPNQVVEAMRDLPGSVYRIRGNHDKVVAGIEDGANFNHAALAAARWTADHLTAANLRFVRELPRGPLVLPEGFSICHGSPLDEDTYVFSMYEAWEIFENYASDLVFFGHTHVPSLFVHHGRDIRVALLRGETGTISIEPGNRYLINPGSPIRSIAPNSGSSRPGCRSSSPTGWRSEPEELLRGRRPPAGPATRPAGAALPRGQGAA